jgi:diacylglycerol kinase family enzyme
VNNNDFHAKLAGEAAFTLRTGRFLVVVNPKATSVSDRLRDLVLCALKVSFDVDVVDTTHRGHGTELARAAVSEGYDAVVAFGGDGTLNEVANGLAGSKVPMAPLPGGNANVFCRLLGVPAAMSEATIELLAAQHWQHRDVDLGRLGDRYFLFAGGIGLDATVVEQVDAHPRQKALYRNLYYAHVAIDSIARNYLMHPPLLTVELEDGRRLDGVTAITQNAAAYTFFGRRTVTLGHDTRLDSGDVTGAVLARLRTRSVPAITRRLLSPRVELDGHPDISVFRTGTAVTVRSRDERPLPLEVDGDFIGTRQELEIGVAPRALRILVPVKS